MQALSRRPAGVPAPGQSTLYPLPYNLEAKSWLAGEYRTARSGRQRRYYRLTRRGQRQLARQSAQWQAVSAVMPALGGVPGGAAG